MEIVALASGPVWFASSNCSTKELFGIWVEDEEEEERQHLRTKEGEDEDGAERCEL